MKVSECISLILPALEKIRSSGISINDIKYIDMYNEYRVMKDAGEKVNYIAEKLSSDYGIKRRKFFYIVKLFESDI